MAVDTSFERMNSTEPPSFLMTVFGLSMVPGSIFTRVLISANSKHLVPLKVMNFPTASFSSSSSWSFCGFSSPKPS